MDPRFLMTIHDQRVHELRRASRRAQLAGRARAMRAAERKRTRARLWTRRARPA
ncbi:MAG TPA: hypothetical protein VIL04_13125 [Solirubrobacterales bacterium]|jgi:hypothetical protein